jgi:predicted PhzF superfamily epimerase YddE/YHI9
MKLAMYQVDAFTERPFHGNPAAVVVLDEWLDDSVLQAVAAENNLSETAFVIPKAEESALRWFTPRVEVDLCGHATLATAHVLFSHHFQTRSELKFRTRSGTLGVSRAGGRLVLDFPARPAHPVEVDAQFVSALGGVRPREALLARDLLAVFDSEEDVARFQPNFERIAELDAYALIVSAPGEACDFVSRFFAPKVGVLEDPVCGSAHCTLVPYWAARFERPTLHARQLSARGGELWCELRGDRVRIGGAAVEFLRGEITLP